MTPSSIEEGFSLFVFKVIKEEVLLGVHERHRIYL
jgi:hypothetical protein